jgi:ribosome-associated toxin RatA of RatAB toxin-antitoxin module
MITAQNEIVIMAPAQRIFDLASDTQRWPEILPHYRYVRVLGSGAAQTLEMSAWRDFIPVRWTAQQWNDAAAPHIRFKHVAGWTRGMDVEWLFEPIPGGTRVRILHEFAFEFPVAPDFLGEYVIGRFFVQNIAGKTLRRIKELAEGL